jgi:transposase
VSEIPENLIEHILEVIIVSMPDAQILLSIPGVGRVTAATFVSEVPDVSRFGSAAKLAAYAGLAPRVRQSGRSLNSVTRPRGGNRRLKNAVIRSSECSVMLGGPARDYYDRKRAEGKSHRQAIRSLARRRIDLVYALLRDGTTYDPSTARV